jgi:hypothetical protein
MLREIVNRFTGWQAFALFVVFLGYGQITSAQSIRQSQSESPSGQSSQSDGTLSPSQNLPSLLTPLKSQTEESPYEPITSRQRLRWFITSTIGPSHLAAGVFSSAFGTALDRPQEYGPHWAGFGSRYGMRLTGIVTGNAIEASAGSLWGEDPRYFRVPDRPVKERLRNIVRLTFVARGTDGTSQPAYARYMAISGNNFLSNMWRVQSEANTQDAFLRTGEGFAGRMAANAFEEFWPDIKSRIFRRNRTEN